ncbi:hypothetical protein F5B20DRAFT_574197 [Whalleya microplaca]|nr:hypothetical protein F5B20DRAFT_574197 [Whalleya microplaca]
MATVAGVSTEGFTVLTDPEDAIADIVFIHGFQGNPYTTWSCRRIPTRITNPHNDNRQQHSIKKTSNVGVYWPRDLLAAEEWCKSARIMTYGYDSRVTSGYANTNKNNLFAHAKDLLYSLHRLKTSRRPIIFVVHSLGGVILKDTLRRSEASEEQDLKDIVQSTAGIVFLGTPHRGSPGLARLGEVVRRTASMIGGLDTNSTLLRSLGTDTPELELSRESFFVLWRTYNFRVKTFQEAHGISGVTIGLINDKVVPDTSSTLDDPREHAETISANHRLFDMCKFALKTDPGYQKVSHEIKTMLNSCQKGPDITRYGCMFLQSLYFPEMYDRQRNIQKALNGTCNWLFSSAQYSNWINHVETPDNHGLLWIKGKPGSGKSTVMKEALRRAHSKYKDTLTSTAAFFFDARGTQLEKKPLGLYRSLLHQVLQQDTRALAHLSSVYEKKIVSQPRVTWHQEELQEFIVSVFATSASRPAVIFIDAMDECDDNEVRDLVRFFSNITKQAFTCGAWLSVCLSSRHYPQISIDRCLELVVEHYSRQDIMLFIVAEAKDRRSIEELKQEIFDKSDGVFLWVVIVISILKKSDRGKSLNWLRQKLSKLPRELADLFSGLFSTVEQDEVVQTVHLMQLVLFARRRLTLDEIHVALGFSLNSYDSIEAWKDSVDYLETARTRHEMIVELSRGLLEPTPSSLKPKTSSGSQAEPENIQETNPTYQFIHETVREFFLSGDGFRLLCLDTVSVIGSGHQTIARAHCFLQYAIYFLLDHIEATEEQGISQESVLSLIRARNLLPILSVDGVTLEGASLLYAASELRAVHTVKRLVRMGHDVNARCTVRHGYPLLAAITGIYSNRELSSEVIQFLLDSGADISVTNLYHQSALHLASTLDSAAVAAILPHHPDINARDIFQYTPLHCLGLGPSEEEEEIALVEAGSPLDTQNDEKETALHHVAHETDEFNYDIYNCLVEAGADRTIVGRDGHTAEEILQLSGFKIDLNTGICGGLISDGLQGYNSGGWTPHKL